MYIRAAQNQSLTSVSYSDYSSDSRILLYLELRDYLNLRSKNYKNVIEIKEIARGGEAIVYRLEHMNIDEVIIKTTKIEDGMIKDHRLI